ncbi:MAG TPA: hypothetical protein DDW36_03065 [Candidatus Magasanikbacteria bacterium]|nr:hypothetical protein [Candidatus Magasanikbacteria bacterium]
MRELRRLAPVGALCVEVRRRDASGGLAVGVVATQHVVTRVAAKRHRVGSVAGAAIRHRRSERGEEQHRPLVRRAGRRDCPLATGLHAGGAAEILTAHVGRHAVIQLAIAVVVTAVADLVAGEAFGDIAQAVLVVVLAIAGLLRTRKDHGVRVVGIQDGGPLAAGHDHEADAANVVVRAGVHVRVVAVEALAVLPAKDETALATDEHAVDVAVACEALLRAQARARVAGGAGRADGFVLHAGSAFVHALPVHEHGALAAGDGRIAGTGVDVADRAAHAHHGVDRGGARRRIGVAGAGIRVARGARSAVVGRAAVARSDAVALAGLGVADRVGPAVVVDAAVAVAVAGTDAGV